METTSTAPSIQPTGCCPPYVPGTWEGREVTWKDRPFVTTHVHSVFHVPLDMDRKMAAAMALIEDADATPPAGLMLADMDSPWGTDLFIDVTHPVPGAKMANLSGTFLTREFEGPYRDAPRWVEEMKRHVAKMGRKIERIFFAYTTCPACAKAYGKNWVVLFAQVAPEGGAG